MGTSARAGAVGARRTHLEVGALVARHQEEFQRRDHDEGAEKRARGHRARQSEQRRRTTVLRPEHCRRNAIFADWLMIALFGNSGTPEPSI